MIKALKDKVGKYLKRLILPAVAIAGLLFLFLNAQPIDPDTHNALAKDLRDLQKSDVELGEAVLQHHYKIMHNYDGVVAIMLRMQSLSVELMRYKQFGALPDVPIVTHELITIQQQIRRKSSALEEFKSHNALIKNSLIYLPRTIDNVLAELPLSNQLEREYFQLLLRDTLLMTTNQDVSTQNTLKATIAKIKKITPALPVYVQPLATLALKHTNIIVQNEASMPSLLNRLSSLPGNHIGTELEQFYLEHYHQQQHLSAWYRILLLLAAMLMLGYGIYAYYLMREKKLQLRVAATTFETQEGIMITDAKGNIIRVNSAFQKITGYSFAEVQGKNPRILNSGRQSKKFYAAMWKQLLNTGTWAGEIWDQHKSGRIYPIWQTITAVKDEAGKTTEYVAIFNDITARKQAEEDIRKLAFYDALTQLPNRRLLMDRLRLALSTSARNKYYGAVLFLDMDKFKTLNDTLGHDYGDLLLIEVAARLQSCVREVDTVARLGGDEFVILLEEIDITLESASQKTAMIAEKIRASLASPYHLNDWEHHSSPSIGVSLYLGNEESAEVLLKHADMAMYQAKDSGRNTVRFFDPAMQFAVETHAALEADLRHAIPDRQLHLHYQIQVDSEYRPIGAEALVRWTHPTRGVVPPAQFIPIAEESSLILDIGNWVLDSACLQLEIWASNEPTRHLTLSVNVSAEQFKQADFVERVASVLRMYRIEAAKLKLELTESVVLNNISDVVAKMHALKALGVELSMDDFGTGYSSLSYLKQMPLDQIKIDQSFVRDIVTDANDAVMVQTIIDMAQNFRLNVIAEGVESKEQLVFLKEHGCMAYQGYFFSKPVPIAQLMALLEQDNRLLS